MTCQQNSRDSSTGRRKSFNVFMLQDMEFLQEDSTGFIANKSSDLKGLCATKFAALHERSKRTQNESVRNQPDRGCQIQSAKRESEIARDANRECALRNEVNAR
jgi:hypothetical protein